MKENGLQENLATGIMSKLHDAGQLMKEKAARDKRLEYQEQERQEYLSRLKLQKKQELNLTVATPKGDTVSAFEMPQFHITTLHSPKKGSGSEDQTLNLREISMRSDDSSAYSLSPSEKERHDFIHHGLMKSGDKIALKQLLQAKLGQKFVDRQELTKVFSGKQTTGKF